MIDYSKIIWAYLSNLETAKEKICLEFKCNFDAEVIKNLEKEISSLKLFSILFLNCHQDFKELNNISYINYSNINNNMNITKSFFINNFSKSNLPQTQKLRKKRLLDWFVYDKLNSSFIKEQINLKTSNGNANLDTKQNQSNLYEIIFFCLINGKIKKALELTNKYNLYNLSGLISQFDMNKGLNNIRLFKEQILKVTADYQINYLKFIYDLLTVDNNISSPQRGSTSVLNKNYNRNPNNINCEQDDNCNPYDKEIMKINPEYDIIFIDSILQKLNWKQFFICNGLYRMDSNQNISDLTNNYIKTSFSLGKKYPSIKSYLVGNNCEELNIGLIKYYTLNTQKNILSDKDKEDFLNRLFLQKNIFTKFSDLHLHFIICTILINTLSEIYGGDISKNFSRDILFLKKIQLKLINRLTEDLLIQGNLFIAIKIILFSNLSFKHKSSMIENIIYKFIHYDELFAFSNKDKNTNLNKSLFKNLNAKVAYDSLGVKNYNSLNIEKAIKYFEKAENYDKLHEVTSFNLYFILKFSIN